jgi:hypothetical protein
MSIISQLLSRSAFFWFCNDERSKVKALNPEFGVGDIATELGRRWSDVDPELKSKYEAMAEKDKARYDRVSCNCLFLSPPHILCEVESLPMFIL